MPHLSMPDPCSHITRLDIIRARLNGQGNEEIFRLVEGHKIYECDDHPIWELASVPEHLPLLMAAD